MTARRDTRYDDADCLPDLLRARAATHPDRVAVSGGGQRLTFAELVARAEEVAGRLRGAGTRPGATVGIFAQPSVDLAAGVWGVLHAGAAYLPLSPDYPDERLRFMVADSGTTVVLTDEALAGRLAGLVPPSTTVLAQGGAPVGTAPDAGPRPRPADLAYVIYTSGSTGRPKGIMIEHGAIVSQLRWLHAAQGLDERRTVLQKTPLSFDAAQWEILASACGSHVVMSEAGAYRDPERLLDLVTANGITTLQAVPTLLQALVGSGRLAECTTLRQLFSGGEALTKRLATELLELLPGCDLINLYGPSECTINTSAHRVDRRTVADGPDVVPIGRPVHGTEYHILDADLAPVAPGDTGELCVSGVQLARGYLHRDDLTAERFVDNPFSTDPRFARLYRTGDLARWNDDGTAQFVGRTDTQVKLRGFRVELDEISVAIEAHDWVRRAAVIVRDDPRTGMNLIAAVQLNAHEAALMDQGTHGAHHQSKRSKLQIKAQLSNAGCRDGADLARRELLPLPGRVPTAEQRRLVFARKTYRFFEGGEVTREDLLRLLDTRSPAAVPRGAGPVTRAELGGILRYFGQFHSPERLLPKYGYASPGSLYATQLYVEVSGVPGVPAGTYYYDPIHHQLALMSAGPDSGPLLRVHLVGRRSAIEPVYRNNIREVLQIEAGHLIGLFDTVLPRYGLRVGAVARTPTVLDRLECEPEDHYLGTADLEPGPAPVAADRVEVYLQSHPGRVADLPAGQYRHVGGRLDRVSDELVQRRHVIAINQQVFERAAFGVTLLSRAADPWDRYLELGRAMQRLQTNTAGLGLMSSGYSSETGDDLPSARRIAEILGGLDGAASYFAVGGRVSEAQRRSEGMKEDVVHMKGPAELIKDDLAERMPHYMVPNRVLVLDTLPLTANGKVDTRALGELDEVAAEGVDIPVVEPRTPTEDAIALLWRQALRRPTVSVREDFFACGGNSLIAVGLISRINRELGSTLPFQELFESPTVEDLARRVDREPDRVASRLVRLRGDGTGRPIFCWPGLGGYPMSLRLLASQVHVDRPFLGIQAYGINPGEAPAATVAEMAARDLEMIRREQPTGPYTLWGYSFGARLAFEAAHQLERAGERVEDLYLIAPGRPAPEQGSASGRGRADFTDPTFVSILFSVFAGGLEHAALEECLAAATDEDSFVDFVCGWFEHLDRDLVRRVVGVVRRTFRFEYAPHELAERRVEAPVTVFTARGDEPSFLHNGEAYWSRPPTTVRLDAGHYDLLRTSGVAELVTAIESLDKERRGIAVPHISIQHFPRTIDEDQMSDLVRAITAAVTTAFACDESAVSIAVESVSEEDWNQQVYVPHIVEGAASLVKTPNY